MSKTFKHNQNINKSSKPINKKKNKQESEDSLDEIERQLEDDDIEQQYNGNKGESYEDKQTVKAQKFMDMMKDNGDNINEDEFFIQDKGDQEENNKVDTALREEYLKQQNLYYEKTGDKYSKVQFAEPVVYKGHTKCITAIQWSPSKQYFFSCSKDGSIIKWNTQTKTKQFLSLGKEPDHHKGQILTMSLNSQGTLLVTAGTDATVKLWDAVEGKLIETLKSHKDEINSVKFGFRNNTFCSVSSDRTFKVWDAAQRTYIDTFYGHRQQGLDIDCIDNENFISSGNDSQVIIWKTQKQTQAVYNGHDFAIDRVRVLNRDCFVTASQDSNVFLWNIKKKKPIFKCNEAHGKNWITSLGVFPSLDIFATGSLNNLINIYQVSPDMKRFQKINSLPTQGIVNDIKINNNSILVVQGDQHRLGRWVTKKCKNQIKLFNII